LIKQAIAGGGGGGGGGGENIGLFFGVLDNAEQY
jgi:hypothetical protein